MSAEFSEPEPDDEEGDDEDPGLARSPGLSGLDLLLVAACAQGAVGLLLAPALVLVGRRHLVDWLDRLAPSSLPDGLGAPAALGTTLLAATTVALAWRAARPPLRTLQPRHRALLLVALLVAGMVWAPFLLGL